ncbi:MAG: DUF3592 domain-containing protein [Pseudomonadota bacterium]
MSVIIILFGAIILFAGVNSWRESREHFRRGQKTEAVIVALREVTIHSGSRPSQGYQAVYAYRDSDGNEHQTLGSRASTRKGAFPIGKRKTVVFNPDYPEEVQDTPVAVFLGLTVSIVAGAGMVAFGIAAFLLDWDL